MDARDLDSVLAAGLARGLLLLGTLTAACEPPGAQVVAGFGGSTSRVSSTADSPRDATAWFESAGPATFRGEPGPGRDCFDAVSADMDLDGDPDLILNWHHRGALELWENRDRGFTLVNPGDDDRSGLWETPGVPHLFADTPAELERLRDAGPGLYVWHDEDREESWRLFLRDPARAFGDVRIELAATLRFRDFEGLEEGELERDGERFATLTLAGGGDRVLRVQTRPVGGHLHLRIALPAAGEVPPLYVGGEHVPIASGEVDLWKADPHGIAWLDVEGSAHPEIYIARGAMAANLLPPYDPKVERYYVHAGGGEPLYRFAAPGRIPAGYQRGRRVEWVDVDGDRRLELSIANKTSRNTLLVRGEGGVYTDRAAEWGIDFEDGEVQCWTDLDGDGRQDLLVLVDDRIDALLQRGERGFERVAGEELGLVLPELSGQKGDLFEYSALRIADQDGDGRLDLWVLGYGEKRTGHLFLRDGEGFRDVTETVGLAGATGRSFLILDVDNDSRLDLVGLLGRARLWKGEEGGGFRTYAFPDSLAPVGVHAGAVLDADGDGRTDVVVVGGERHFLRNVSGGNNGWLDVELEGWPCEPIGAVVRARYTGGRVVAQRYGSATSSTFSQTLLPLHFGIPAGNALERLTVRWPGETEERSYPVERTGTRISLAH